MATVLITGASSGIGLELARIFALHDYELVLVSRSKPPLDQSVFGKTSIIWIQKDLTKVSACADLFDELKMRNLSVDILVNNAGFGDYGLFYESSFKKQAAMIDLNIKALTELTHLFLKEAISKKSGKILNVASIASFFPGPYMAVYYATKHYVLAFSQALSAEVKPMGITVTALCPGQTKTNFQKRANMNQEAIVSGKNLASPEAVARFGFEQLMKGKSIAIYGVSNQLFVLLARCLPGSIMTRLILHILGPAKSAFR